MQEYCHTNPSNFPVVWKQIYGSIIRSFKNQKREITISENSHPSSGQVPAWETDQIFYAGSDTTTIQEILACGLRFFPPFVNGLILYRVVELTSCLPGVTYFLRFIYLF